jgi:hypothetical protein
MLKSSKFWWGVAAGVLVGVVAAPKIRAMVPGAGRLPSFNGN